VDKKVSQISNRLIFFPEKWKVSKRGRLGSLLATITALSWALSAKIIYGLPHLQNARSTYYAWETEQPLSQTRVVTRYPRSNCHSRLVKTGNF
jgi:hypothetical protein